MGDGVNVAARLEGINKEFGTTICISDSVVEAVGSDIVARPIKKVQVKGRKHKFMVYELLGIRTSDDPELAPKLSETQDGVEPRIIPSAPCGAFASIGITE